MSTVIIGINSCKIKFLSTFPKKKKILFIIQKLRSAFGVSFIHMWEYILHIKQMSNDIVTNSCTNLFCTLLYKFILYKLMWYDKIGWIKYHLAYMIYFYYFIFSFNQWINTTSVCTRVCGCIITLNKLLFNPALIWSEWTAVVF